MQDHPRYTQRTVEWGHWGITFMDPQTDRSKNFGEIVGTVFFPVGTRGPCDGTVGSLQRHQYRDICAAWVSDRAIPDGFQPRA